jgi:hypothetical protein
VARYSQAQAAWTKCSSPLVIDQNTCSSRDSPRVPPAEGSWSPGLFGTMRNPEQCREQANHYREQASTAKTVLERARFEELELTWQRLATHLEKASALLDHLSRDKVSDWDRRGR